MVVGVTGGIGSGKSTVTKLFGLLGCPVFDSDRHAKEVYFEPGVQQKVSALLGKESYVNTHQINKTHINALVFSNKQLLEQLNKIIHPVVKQKWLKFAEQHRGKIIIKETALLFEVQLEKEMDAIVVVAANEDIRIARVMRRDGLSKEAVALKIKQQWPQEEKINRADFVIDNNGTELIIPQVLKVFKVLSDKNNA